MTRIIRRSTDIYPVCQKILAEKLSDEEYRQAMTCFYNWTNIRQTSLIPDVIYNYREGLCVGADDVYSIILISPQPQGRGEAVALLKKAVEEYPVSVSFYQNDRSFYGWTVDSWYKIASERCTTA